MDKIDEKILQIVSLNANTPAQEIGKAVNLSIPAVNKRLQKLKGDGVIRSYTVITDSKKVMKPIVAFVLIVMQYSKDTENFLKTLNEDPDVLECYAVTGEYDYVIKIYAKSVDDFESKLLKIKRHRGVLKSHTMFALEEHKYSATVLPMQ